MLAIATFLSHRVSCHGGGLSEEDHRYEGKISIVGYDFDINRQHFPCFGKTFNLSLTSVSTVSSVHGSHSVLGRGRDQQIGGWQKRREQP